MRIVIATKGTIEAERRVAAAMLNIEHGAIAFDDNLVPLPAPHKPATCIAVPPITTNGLPVEVHYRPSVGVVFYTGADGLKVRDMVARIAAMLGTEHLTRWRVTAATPSSVLRKDRPCSAAQTVIGARKMFKSVRPSHDLPPARILMWPPPNESTVEFPLHYSIRASFTWVFMPASAAIKLPHEGADPRPVMERHWSRIRENWSPTTVNVVMASILYDAAQMTNLADNSEIFRGLTMADISVPFRTDNLNLDTVEAGDRLSTTHRGLLIRTNGSIELVGDIRTLSVVHHPIGHPTDKNSCKNAPTRKDRLALLNSYPLINSRPSNILSGGLICCHCNVPVGDETIVLTGNYYSRSAVDRSQYKAAEAKLPHENNSILFCMRCWHGMSNPACLTAHLGAALVRRWKTGLTQAATCQTTGINDFVQMAQVLSGTAAPIEGVVGAFVVTMKDGSSIVIAGSNLGPVPEFTVPRIAALKLRVYGYLRIVEEK